MNIYGYFFVFDTKVPTQIGKNYYPANIYLFKVSNGNARNFCEISSKLTIEAPKRHHWSRSGVLILNFKQIPHCSDVSIVNLDQINVGLVHSHIPNIEMYQADIYLSNNSAQKRENND